MSEERLARYRLLRRIGAGGMAEVFRAELEGAEGVTRELVVKRVHHRLAQDPAAVAMFIEEARIAARLRHPNVVQVYEFGRAGDDYFLAMELVEGCDLATLLRAWGQSPAPPGVIAWVMGELLEALSYVHGLCDDAGRPLGLVHRDVSPHNVLVGVAGEVKLADFGIAKAASRIEDHPGEGRVKGKLAFMAPEQARGETPDARADLFGAGATLYELLCGRRPYREREGVAPAEAVRAGDVVPIRERAPWLSDELCDVVMRAIAPSRNARFSDAQSFRDALRVAFAEDAVVADRAMLQSAVRAALASQGDASPPRAERTVTADDAPAIPPEPVAPAPVSIAAPPSGSSRARRVVERFMIAVAVFVVAALAERRTRPPPPSPTPPPEAPVGVSAPRAVQQIAPELLRRIERACGVALQTRNAGSADLTLGPWRDVAATSDALAAQERWLDASARSRADEDARALSVSLRGERDAPGVLRFAPVGVDPVVFFSRRASVDALTAAPQGALDAQRGVIAEGFGRLPRALRVPSEDIDGWGVWDVVMASIALRSNASVASRVWVPAGDTDTAALTWAARAVTHDPDAARDLGPSFGPTAVLGWDRALYLLDALQIGADTADEDVLPPADPAVAFGWSPLSRMRGADLTAWRISRPPRGDDWQLDARGEALRVGAHLAPAELYGWSATTRSGERRAVRCVLSEFVRPEVMATVRGATGWSRVGAAPAWAEGALDPALREALDGARVTVLRDGTSSSTVRRAAWWALWRDAVLGSARGAAHGDPAQRDRLGARARALFGARARSPER